MQGGGGVTHGVYIGGDVSLKGRGALLVLQQDGRVKAQFDDLKLHSSLTHHWKIFPANAFVVDRV